MPLRFLLVDDHAVIRKGLKQILVEEFSTAIVEEASDAETAIKMSLSGNWNMVISDLSMPGRSGLDLVDHMRENFPSVPVLILSIHPEDHYAIRVLKAGAAGYMSKEAATSELITAVKKIIDGRKYISSSVAEKMADQLNRGGDKQPHEVLSDREFEVFKLIAAGKTVGYIADVLALSITTVSTYRSRILAKMDMQSNAELTRYALENALI